MWFLSDAHEVTPSDDVDARTTRIGGRRIGRWTSRGAKATSTRSIVVRLSATRTRSYAPTLGMLGEAGGAPPENLRAPGGMRGASPVWRLQRRYVGDLRHFGGADSTLRCSSPLG